MYCGGAASHVEMGDFTCKIDIIRSTSSGDIIKGKMTYPVFKQLGHVLPFQFQAYVRRFVEQEV